jgi:hypothetical protein
MNKLDTLEPEFRAKVEQVISGLKDLGIKVGVVCARRTLAEQNELYAQGRTAVGPVVTNARGGSSPHNFGLAVDLCPFHNDRLDWNADDKIWRAIADMAVGCGLVAGYYFKSIHDAPHIEDPNWRASQLAWKQGDLKVT